MPSLKLTERTVGKLAAPTPTGKQAIFWDSEIKGFGVLCSGVSNAKTFVVQRALPNGRTRRVTIGPTNVLALAEARDKAEAVLAQFYQGIDPKGGRRDAATLQEGLDQYLLANKMLSENSRVFYRKIVERHLASWLALPLRSITPEMVEQRHRSIQTLVSGSGRNKGHAMANSVMTAFGIVYNFAAEATPSLPPNPVRRLKRQWFAVPRRTRMVKADQMPTFYKAALGLENQIHCDLILLLLFTGLRKSEAAGLRWDDIDFAAHLVRIPAERMKAKTKHDLPMSDFVHDLLVVRRAFGKAALVFPSNGRAVDAKPAFRLIAEKTGISVSSHDLRRTYMTVAESTDISPMALKALAAHSVGSDVTAGYVQMSSERLREAAQRVCDRMKTLCGIEDVAGGNIAKLKG